MLKLRLLDQPPVILLQSPGQHDLANIVQKACREPGVVVDVEEDEQRLVAGLAARGVKVPTLLVRGRQSKVVSERGPDHHWLWHVALLPFTFIGDPGQALAWAAAANAAATGAVAASLSIARSGTGVVITWSGGVLQESSSVTGGFQDVAGAVSPVTVAAPSGGVEMSTAITNSAPRPQIRCAGLPRPGNRAAGAGR